VRDFGRERGATQEASPQRAVPEEQRRGRPKDPPLLTLFEIPIVVSIPVRTSSQTPLRVFVRWLLGNQGVIKGHKPHDAETSSGLLRFGLFSILLTFCFLRPISVLINFALHSNLYSHIVLIPFVTLFLIWRRVTEAPLTPDRPLRTLCLLPLIPAVVLLSGYWLNSFPAGSPADYLSIMISAYVFLAWSGALVFLNATTARTLAFPLAFLVFMIPFPDFLLHQIESLLQVGSAAVAHVFFQIVGTPVFRHGMFFQLPGFSLEVASECSGIHSSLVLLITSAVGAHVLLRTPWAKLLLISFIIPLALLRNGFRIFTIGELCIHISPDLSHSWIHRQGGPIFFLLSMIPFLALLGLLIRAERRQRTAK